METRETMRFTVTGTVPPSVSSCVVDPVMTKASVRFSLSRLTRLRSSSSVRMSEMTGALTRAQTVRMPEVAVSWASIASPAFR